jgi:hypothetical protein
VWPQLASPRRGRRGSSCGIKSSGRRGCCARRRGGWRGRSWSQPSRTGRRTGRCLPVPVWPPSTPLQPLRTAIKTGSCAHVLTVSDARILPLPTTTSLPPVDVYRRQSAAGSTASTGPRWRASPVSTSFCRWAQQSQQQQQQQHERHSSNGRPRIAFTVAVASFGEMSGPVVGAPAAKAFFYRRCRPLVAGRATSRACRFGEDPDALRRPRGRTVSTRAR